MYKVSFLIIIYFYIIIFLNSCKKIKWKQVRNSLIVLRKKSNIFRYWKNMQKKSKGKPYKLRQSQWIWMGDMKENHRKGLVEIKNSENYFHLRSFSFG